MTRTARAVAEDAADRTEGIALTHAERRGDPAGAPGRPSEAEVRAAADRQLEDVKAMGSPVARLATFVVENGRPGAQRA